MITFKIETIPVYKELALFYNYIISLFQNSPPCYKLRITLICPRNIKIMQTNILKQGERVLSLADREVFRQLNVS